MNIKKHNIVRTCGETLRLSVLILSSVGVTSAWGVYPPSFFTERALTKNPNLRAQKSAAIAAEKSFKSESIFPSNPTLQVALMNAPVRDFPGLNKDPLTGITVGLSQTIAFPWEASPRKAAAEERFFSEKQNTLEMKIQLAYQTLAAYNQLQFSYHKKFILENNARALEKIATSAKGLVAVGKMNAAQLMRLHAELELLKSQKKESDAEIAEARAALEVFCGEEIDWQTEAKYDGSWIKSELETFTLPDFDFHKHPLYKKAYHIWQAEKGNESLARGKLFPDITFGVNYMFRKGQGTMPGEDMVSFMASTPLPAYYPLKETHSIDAASQRVKSAEESLQATRVTLIAGYKAELEKYRQLTEVFHNFRKHVSPSYLTAYKSMSGTLASGNVSFLDVLDVYRSYLASSHEEGRILRELANSRLKLDYYLSRLPVGEAYED